MGGPKITNPRWRTVAILKTENHDISKTSWRKLTKFCDDDLYLASGP